jgi:zinc-ribbon domain
VLVCPACRSENVEQAQFCSRCGRSLIPEEGSIRRLERHKESGSFMDVPAPTQASPVPGILTLVGIVVVGLGVGL